jgi:hypothetical protein
MLKPLLAFLFLFVHFSPNNALQADIVDQLAANFRLGNSKEIAKNFSSSIELIIVDQEDVYSKAQAEQILKDFFIKNPPSKVSIVHQLNNVPFRLGILYMQTKSGKFRVTISMALKKPSNTFLITELRIEADKE